MSLTLNLSGCQLSLCWKGAPAPGPAGVSLCSFPTNPIIPWKGGVGTVAAGRGRWDMLFCAGWTFPRLSLHGGGASWAEPHEELLFLD